MSKRSRIDYESPPDVKKSKQTTESPTSLVLPTTAKLSNAKYSVLGYKENEGKYIAEYILEIHGNIVCPNYIRIFYDEIRTDIKYTYYNATRSKSIKNLDTLLDFVENKCSDYRFVASILTITYYIMNDMNFNESMELKEWDKNKLEEFYLTKRPNIRLSPSTNYHSRYIYPHANAILIDRELRQVERFEPHGSESIMASPELDKLLNDSFNKIGYKYFSPKSFCPRESVQTIHGLAKNPLYKDLGYCTIWSLWYMDNRLLNPMKTREETLNIIIEMFKSKDEKFIHETIHSYWSNLYRYIELRNANNSPKRAIEILYHESIPKLGEEMLLNNPQRAITTYKKPKSIFSKIYNYLGY